MSCISDKSECLTVSKSSPPEATELIVQFSLEEENLRFMDGIPQMTSHPSDVKVCSEPLANGVRPKRLRTCGLQALFNKAARHQEGRKPGVEVDAKPCPEEAGGGR